ncbi:S1 RNA-binding domain-containing protein, partial [Patescibacteria group bacterium]|nr:S1 RNA-binding domain-containing protein [Patescibacteria group bacterium]
EIAPNTEGLVHISEIAPFRIESVNGILNVGDRVPVIIKKIDEKNRINLSIKDVDPNFVKNPKKKV